MKWTTGFLSAAIFFLPTPLLGQVEISSDILPALSDVRSGHASTAAALLSGEEGSLSGREKQALADSLVAIAISTNPGDNPDAFAAAGAARDALLLAGVSKNGTPFPHAFETLVRVFSGTQDPGARGGTLWVISQLPNRGVVVDFLATVAVSDDSTCAEIAIRHLANDTGSAGLTRLRRLFDEGEVTDPLAKELLTAIAAAHGWGSLSSTVRFFS